MIERALSQPSAGTSQWQAVLALLKTTSPPDSRTTQPLRPPADCNTKIIHISSDNRTGKELNAIGDLQISGALHQSKRQQLIVRGRRSPDFRDASNQRVTEPLEFLRLEFGSDVNTRSTLSIAKSHTAKVATWQRPHPYVGSHGTAAPQQYGCWNAGAAPSARHCARASPIEQKSVPGPEVS
jgi:hypothetical protein